MPCIYLWNAHDIITSFHLLTDQWPRWSHEYDLSRGIPRVVVIHHHSRDQSLPQSSRQTYQSVTKYRCKRIKAFLSDQSEFVCNSFISISISLARDGSPVCAMSCWYFLTSNEELRGYIQILNLSKSRDP